MNAPFPSILSIGLASPRHDIAQEAASRFAVSRAGVTNGAAAFVERIYRNSRVDRRGSVLLAPELGRPDAIPFFDDSPIGMGPSTAERLKRFELEAAPLATTAAAQALSRASTGAQDITHLVTVSCTGMAAPGVDFALMNSLGLRSTVQRTHIGFMGCFGAIVGLRTAAAIAKADPTAVVLVVSVELCSLHFQYSPAPDQAVANALFSDGAAAAVVASVRRDSSRPVIASSASAVLPDSAGMMSWRVGDHGFEMTLAAAVPTHIRTHMRPWIEGWLQAQSLTIEDVGSWALHPGGPRIISAVTEALSLPPSAAAPAERVLAAHGNMSSATVLFVLDAILRTPAPLPCVMLAFGPGLTVEAILLTSPAAKKPGAAGYTSPQRPR